MNFLNFLLFVLSNQRGELNLDDGPSLDDLVSEVETESAGSDTAEPTSEESSNSEPAESESQPKEELSLEEQLENVEGTDASGNLLELVNGLGILRKGLPVEFNDEEELKSILSQGYDYTQKTQALSQEREQFEKELTEQREAFEKERQEFAQQNEEMVQTYPLLTAAIQRIATEEPELFEELDRYYRQVESQMGFQQSTNPKYDQKIKELESKLEAQAREKEEAQLNEIREGWTNGLKEVQAKFAPKLRTLGVKVDWSKVKETWESDSTNKMSVNQALMATYGESITKALESKNKLANTKAKAANKGLIDNDEATDDFGTRSGNSYVNAALDFAKTLDAEV